MFPILLSQMRGSRILCFHIKSLFYVLYNILILSVHFIETHRWLFKGFFFNSTRDCLRKLFDSNRLNIVIETNREPKIFKIIKLC